MAIIAATSMSGPGQRLVSETTLTGTGDTFTYVQNSRQVLILRNPTAGAISPVIDGDGADSVTRDGVGTIDISGGYAVDAIAAGAVRAIPLDTISAYLQGDIAITGGTGLVAILLNR
ncbi:hypothetical protein [Pararhodobacter marinus]|nr:hypothetical protein [Pararhodobacter marinus]